MGATLKKNLCQWLTIGVLVLAWGWGMAVPWSFGQEAWVKLRVQPFHRAKQLALFGEPLKLLSDDAAELEAFVSDYLQGAGLHPGYQLEREALAAVSRKHRQAQVFRVLWQGKPLCRAYVQAHRLRGGQPLVRADLPDAVGTPPPDFGSLWPSVDEAWAQLRTAQAPTPLVAGAAEACYLWTEGQWQAVWELSYRLGSLPYLAYADSGRVYRNERRYSHLTGTLGAYRSNPLDGVVTEQAVELNGDGTLTNARFTTKPKGVTRAQSSSHRFVVPTTDNTFPEITSFAAINRMYDWLHARGYNWQGAPLNLRIHELIEVEGPDGTKVPWPNNAFSMPANGGEAAYILLGDGDGVYLKNLGLDSDVVSHEFNHQYIYTTLFSNEVKEESSQPVESHEHSGVIHEGLADYFTNASTGDACLGESVCPENSTFCYDPGTCMRTAEQTLTYGSDDYWAFYKEGLPHLQGQILSGLLWDLRKDAGGKAADIDQMVVDAVAYLTKRSSYADFLLALLSADYDNNEGRYACAIEAQAKKRGLTAALAEVLDDCKAFVPASAKPSTEDEKPKSPPRPRGGSLQRVCGSNDQAKALPGIPVLGLPLLLAAWQLRRGRKK